MARYSGVLIKLSSRMRKDDRLLFGSAFLVCCGIMLNRFVMTIQTLALPTLPFDEFLTYSPSWEEVAAFLFVVAYGVILYSLTYRYTTIFPQERELALNNPDERQTLGERSEYTVGNKGIFGTAAAGSTTTSI